MNPGSEPERDDAGLPRVDVEVPDDARDLDRDFQAYYRELRAERRHRRSRRLRHLLARDSMVLPLLICCLVCALVAGTLLTLFTASSIDQSLPGQSRASPPSGSRSPAAPVLAKAPPALAADAVSVHGAARAIGSLRPSLLIAVPAGCGCTADLSRLAVQAADAHMVAYLLYQAGGAARAGRLARAVGNRIQVAQDVTGRLDRGYPGLTVFLVTRAGAVSYADHLQTASRLQELLRTDGL